MPSIGQRAAICAYVGIFAGAVSHAEQAQHLNPDSMPPASGYSHVVVAPPGRLVSISGQVALDKSGNLVGAGDFEAQCVQVFENLKSALASVGLTFTDVIRTDHYITDIEHLPVLREVRSRYLPAQNRPASTLVQVDSLFRPDLMVEVSVDAIKRDVESTSSN
jgi:enamine deaminase RidA (YjgF/YER057c/UK114 family)